MKLSVIIPVYNVEDYLESCLNHLVKGYKNKDDIEIILIDDGSTDNSKYICDYYAKKFVFIKVVHKNNGGISKARNLGINISKGEMITFIDSDDLVPINYLNVLLDILKNTNADIISFKYKIVQNGLFNKPVEYSSKKMKNATKVDMMTSVVRDSYTWDKIYKRKLWKDITFPSFRNYEDIATTYKIFEKARKFLVYDDVLYFYRQRSGSITHQNSASIKLRAVTDAIIARKEQLNFFEKNNYQKAYKLVTHDLMINAFTLIRWTIQYKLKKDNLYKEMVIYLKKYEPSIRADGIKYYLMIKAYKNVYPLYLILIYFHKKRIRENMDFYN